MAYKGFIKKSRSLDFYALVGVVGVVESNFPLLSEQLGDYYGWSFIGIAVIGSLLRYATTGPVGDK